jgi:hypothetical protein
MFINYWVTFFLLHLSISGLVNMVMISYPGQSNASSKQTICVGIIVILWSFAGVSPTYTKITKNLGTLGIIVNRLSPFAYSHELEFIYELQPYPTIFNTNIILDKFNFEYPNKNGCLIALILFWLITNFIAYLILESNHSRLYEKYKTKLSLLILDIKFNIYKLRYLYRKKKNVKIKNSKIMNNSNVKSTTTSEKTKAMVIANNNNNNDIILQIDDGKLTEKVDNENKYTNTINTTSINNNYGNNNDRNNEMGVELNDIQARTNNIRNSNNSTVSYNDNKTTSVRMNNYQLNPLHVKENDLV